MFSLSLGLRNHYKARAFKSSRAACGTTPPARLRRGQGYSQDPGSYKFGVRRSCSGRGAYGLPLSHSASVETETNTELYYFPFPISLCDLVNMLVNRLAVGFSRS
jgi:hypothetical protein